jgi:hypothetical protein
LAIGPSSRVDDGFPDTSFFGWLPDKGARDGGDLVRKDSTTDQNLASQITALAKVGCARVSDDKASGAKWPNPIHCNGAPIGQ